MLVDLILVLVMLSNFALLGTSRIHMCIRTMAAQGIAISLLPLLLEHHGEGELRMWLLVIAAVAIKGGVIPTLLQRALSRVKIRLEVEPYIGMITSMLLCAAGTGATLLFAKDLPLRPGQEGSLLVPASLATVLTGFLVLTSRRKAITQVVGFTVMENGIFLFGLLLLGGEMPMPIEAAVLLDLFAGIFVMGIVINHIQRSFNSLDTQRLSELKEQ